MAIILPFFALLSSSAASLDMLHPGHRWTWLLPRVYNCHYFLSFTHRLSVNGAAFHCLSVALLPPHHGWSCFFPSAGSTALAPQSMDVPLHVGCCHMLHASCATVVLYSPVHGWSCVLPFTHPSMLPRPPMTLLPPFVTPTPHRSSLYINICRIRTVTHINYYTSTH